MKLLLFQGSIQLLVSLSLLTVSSTLLHAESHCPANIPSVTPRFVARALIVIPVKINGAGPYDFMVDTGSEMTVIDPALATEIGFKGQERVKLISVSREAQVVAGLVDRLEAASQVVEKPMVVVQDLGQIRAADPRIRGVLGQNFLTHFDILIDYERKLFCLDDTQAMRNKVRGERVPLLAPQHPETKLPDAGRLIISVQLSGIRDRQVLLQLDSGSDGPILYPAAKGRDLPILKKAVARGSDASPEQRAFAELPTQKMRIGGRTLQEVYFVTPVDSGQSAPERDEDGLLPTVLFQRVFISFAEHCVVFDPQ